MINRPYQNHEVSLCQRGIRLETISGSGLSHSICTSVAAIPRSTAQIIYRLFLSFFSWMHTTWPARFLPSTARRLLQPRLTLDVGHFFKLTSFPLSSDVTVDLDKVCFFTYTFHLLNFQWRNVIKATWKRYNTPCGTWGNVSMFQSLTTNVIEVQKWE